MAREPLRTSIAPLNFSYRRLASWLPIRDYERSSESSFFPSPDGRLFARPNFDARRTISGASEARRAPSAVSQVLRVQFGEVHFLADSRARRRANRLVAERGTERKWPKLTVEETSHETVTRCRWHIPSPGPHEVGEEPPHAVAGLFSCANQPAFFYPVIGGRACMI